MQIGNKRLKLLTTIATIFFAATVLINCESVPKEHQPASEDAGQQFLFNAPNSIQDAWRHLPIRGKTDFRLIADKGEISIRAKGNNSASGLVRRVDVDTSSCPILEWKWRVISVQASADLRVREKEDVSASIFLMFGDPGFMSNPTPVPTLRYVWTNADHTEGSIIDSPYLPGVVRSVVVRTGKVGQWSTESRNLTADYQEAFGSAPKDFIHAIALFTDNDQTKEPVEAHYQWAKVICN